MGEIAPGRVGGISAARASRHFVHDNESAAVGRPALGARRPVARLSRAARRAGAGAHRVGSGIGTAHCVRERRQSAAGACSGPPARARDADSVRRKPLAPDEAVRHRELLPHADRGCVRRVSRVAGDSGGRRDSAGRTRRPGCGALGSDGTAVDRRRCGRNWAVVRNSPVVARRRTESLGCPQERLAYGGRWARRRPIARSVDRRRSGPGGHAPHGRGGVAAGRARFRGGGCRFRPTQLDHCLRRSSDSAVQEFRAGQARNRATGKRSTLAARRHHSDYRRRRPAVCRDFLRKHQCGRPPVRRGRFHRPSRIQ